MENHHQDLPARVKELLTRLSKVRRKRLELENEELRLRDDLVAARKLLHTWRATNNIVDPIDPLPDFVFDHHRHVRARKPKARNPSRAVVVDAACKLISEAGRPLGRKELYDQLVAGGVEIQGTRPEVVLTTMLWRSQDRVVRVGEMGYWLASASLKSTYETTKIGERGVDATNGPCIYRHDTAADPTETAVSSSEDTSRTE